MRLSSKPWKKWVRRVLGVILALDAILLVANLRAVSARGDVAQLRQREKKLQLQHDLLAADGRRVSGIRDHLPQVQRDCDDFFAKQFLDGATAYSTIVADLGEIAKSTGIRTSGVTFKQRELEKRGVSEVEVTTTVEGEYGNLVRFVNGLERSKNFYLLDSLALASSAGGNIRLNLHLRTYLRS